MLLSERKPGLAHEKRQRGKPHLAPKPVLTSGEKKRKKRGGDQSEERFLRKGPTMQREGFSKPRL